MKEKRFDISLYQCLLLSGKTLDITRSQYDIKEAEELLDRIISSNDHQSLVKLIDSTLCHFHHHDHIDL